MHVHAGTCMCVCVCVYKRKFMSTFNVVRTCTCARNGMHMCICMHDVQSYMYLNSHIHKLIQIDIPSSPVKKLPLLHVLPVLPLPLTMTPVIRIDLCWSGALGVTPGCLQIRSWLWPLGVRWLARVGQKEIIIIIVEMTVFNVAGYLIEERRRWPVITASPRGQYSK